MLKNWRLISSNDISPNPWFPLEKRAYQLPNGNVVDDFYITTIADAVLVVPILQTGEIVFVRQFKPGYGEVVLEFPAGRVEKSHTSLEQAALHELEEEAGIRAEQVEFFASFTGFPTKGTERVHCFFSKNLSFNARQHLDENEDIEIVKLFPEEIDQKIASNEIVVATTIAAWEVAKKKLFS